MHNLLDHNTRLQKQVILLFGESVRDKNNTLNRGEILKRLTRQKSKYPVYNGIIHPYVLREIKWHLKKSKAKIIIADIPLLYEVRIQNLFDYIVVVHSPIYLQIQRKQKQGWSKTQVEFIISKQQSLQSKVKRADFSIRNNGSRFKLKREVENVWKKLHQKRKP